MTVDGNGNGYAGGYGSGAPGAYGPGYAGPPAHTPVLAAGYRGDLEPEGMTLSDYLGVIWRRKWIIALVVVVATASAYYFSSRQTSQYEAEATIIYKEQIDLDNPLSGSSTSTTNLDREIASIDGLLQGPTLRQRIDTILDKDLSLDRGVEYTVKAQGQASEDSAASTNVVVFTARSSSPQLAAAVANAATEAYVAWNQDSQRNQIKEAIPVIEQQLKKYNSDESKQTADYLMLKQRLQDLEILMATATGNYRQLAPAVTPVEPVEPRPLRSAILGFGVGLFAAIGLAFLLEQFDTRVRRQDEVAGILRQPILGRVPRISRKVLARSALVAMRHPDGHVAEAFRMIRTNLDFMAVDGEIKTMVLTSCNQGEGKSIAIANLAVSMALTGKKVIVVDADLRRARQHQYFGIPNERGVSTVCVGKHGLRESLVGVNLEQVAGGDAGGGYSAWVKGTDALSRLYVLPSGPAPPNPGEIVASRRFGEIIAELREEADVVLVDSAPLLAVGDASAIAARVDGLVFLADLGEVKKPQLMTGAAQLFRLPVRLLGCVIRAHTSRAGRYRYNAVYSYYHYGYVSDAGEAGERRRARRRAEDQAPV